MNQSVMTHDETSHPRRDQERIPIEGLTLHVTTKVFRVIIKPLTPQVKSNSLRTPWQATIDPFLLSLVMHSNLCCKSCILSIQYLLLDEGILMNYGNKGLRWSQSVVDWWMHTYIHTWRETLDTEFFIYIYIYIYTHTHTHTHHMVIANWGSVMELKVGLGNWNPKDCEVGVLPCTDPPFFPALSMVSTNLIHRRGPWTLTHSK
jgi:hypothetical protein